MLVSAVLLLVATVIVADPDDQLTPVQSKLDQVSYLYPNQVREERQLAECTAGEVCSTEHSRYWLPMWVRRYCRCPTSDCSEYVANLDNRSRIKMCTSDRDLLDICSDREIGLEATTITGERTSVSINCRCNWPAYWALVGHIENSTVTHDKYACQLTMRRCQTNDFCGHIRSDTYAMYLQCSCPHNHICLNKDRNKYNVTEALYQGPAMRAYCQSLKQEE